MNEMPRIINLISIQKPAMTKRLIRQVAPYSSVVALDLEDGLWDIFNPQYTAQLKAAGRENLIALASESADLFANHAVAIRVNKLSGEEFANDLTTLAEISKCVGLFGIVATKVETAEDLRQYTDLFAARKIKSNLVIPIVETVKGFANIREISLEAAHMGIPGIVYGHFDYSLDAGHWPFLEHDETAFWEHVTRFIEQVEDAGVNYIHAPCLHLYNHALFAEIFHQLEMRCKHNFGLLAISQEQSSVYYDLLQGKSIERSGLHPTLYSNHEKHIELAKLICNSYNKNLHKGKSFAVDAPMGYFISPHMYLAARNFLDEIKANDA